MKFLPLIIYILSFATGFANLSLIVLTWIKTRERIHLIHGLIILSLAVYLVVIDFIQVTWVITEGSFTWPGPVFFTLMLGSRIPLYLLVLPFFAGIFGIGFRTRSFKSMFVAAVYILFVLASLGSLFFIILSWFRNPWLHHRLFIPIFNTSNLIMLATGALGIIAALLRNRERSLVSERVRRIIILVLTLLFPFWIMQIFYKELGIKTVYPFNYENILFFVWNLGGVVWYLRALVRGDILGAAPAGYTVSKDVFRELSGREREIALLAGRGKSNKDIAIELDISPATVKNHLYNLYPKLGVPSRYALMDLVRSKDH